MTPSRPRHGARRSPATRSRASRLLVPILLGALAVVAGVIVLLAAAVLMGWIPYPGR